MTKRTFKIPVRGATAAQHNARNGVTVDSYQFTPIKELNSDERQRVPPPRKKKRS